MLIAECRELLTSAGFRNISERQLCCSDPRGRLVQDRPARGSGPELPIGRTENVGSPELQSLCRYRWPRPMIARCQLRRMTAYRAYEARSTRTENVARRIACTYETA